MKIRRLTVQLNVIHLVHLIASLLIVFIVSLFLLRGGIYKRMKSTLIVNNKQFVDDIKTDLHSVENVSSFVMQQLEATKANTLSSDLVNAIKLNPLIDSVRVISFTNKRFKLVDGDKWKTEINNDSLFNIRYIHQIDFEHQLIIDLNPMWIERILILHKVRYPVQRQIFNNDFCITVRDSNYIRLCRGKIDVHKIDALKNNSVFSNDGVFLNKFDITNADHFYYAHVLYEPKTNLFITITHPRNYVFSYLGHYLSYLILVFTVVLIIMTNSVLRTNNKYIKPYSEIFQYLRSSKYIKLNLKSNISESMFIKRSIDLLHNQLDFYVKNLEKATGENRKIEKDLKIAKHLQNNILARDIPELVTKKDFSICAISEAAYDIGGDLYDYFILNDEQLLFAVGDISGKGIPAALFMIYTQTLMRSLAKSDMSVSEIVEQLNNKLIEENISDLFVTLLMGILNFKTGKLTYCNAAHNLPLVIRNEGIIEEIGETHGIPVGIYPDRNYTYSEIQLEEGDQFMIYTDGVVDSKDENGMNYSVDVLKYNLMGAWFLTPQEAVSKIQKSIVEFRGNIDPVDDLTILMLQYNHKVNS